jgi:hypothetical protein
LSTTHSSSFRWSVKMDTVFIRQTHHDGVTWSLVCWLRGMKEEKWKELVRKVPKIGMILSSTWYVHNILYLDN